MSSHPEDGPNTLTGLMLMPLRGIGLRPVAEGLRLQVGCLSGLQEQSFCLLRLQDLIIVLGRGTHWGTVSLRLCKVQFMQDVLAFWI